MFLFHFGNKQPYEGNGTTFSGGLMLYGTICLVFGIAILLAPQLLAFIVATLLIFVGLTMLTTGWRIRKK